MSNAARFAAALLVCAVAGRAVPGAAQVGHDPATSPFRDVTTAQALTVQAGWWFGNEGDAGNGSLAGPMLGLRATTRLSAPLELMILLNYIQSERYVIDPNKPPLTRTSGPVDMGMVDAEIGLNFNLTGAKTWHGLAPFVGFAMGLIVPTNGGVDPGGFEVKSNWTFVPRAGTRLHLSRSLAMLFEVRDNTIQYEYPLSYFRPTDGQGNVQPFDPVLDPLRYDEKDITNNFSLSFGLSYRFNF
jgi:hypothetical protein